MGFRRGVYGFSLRVAGGPSLAEVYMELKINPVVHSANGEQFVSLFCYSIWVRAMRFWPREEAIKQRITR